MHVKDDREKLEYGSGAKKHDSSGKGRYDLISPFALRRLAVVLEEGAKIYGDRNWEKGLPYSRHIDSAKRHLDQWIAGMKDEDHLAMALWHLHCLLHHEALAEGRINELDDRGQYDGDQAKRALKPIDPLPAWGPSPLVKYLADNPEADPRPITRHYDTMTATQALAHENEVRDQAEKRRMIRRMFDDIEQTNPEVRKMISDIEQTKSKMLCPACSGCENWECHHATPHRANQQCEINCGNQGPCIEVWKARDPIKNPEKYDEIVEVKSE